MRRPDFTEECVLACIPARVRLPWFFQLVSMGHHYYGFAKRKPGRNGGLHESQVKGSTHACVITFLCWEAMVRARVGKRERRACLARLDQMLRAQDELLVCRASNLWSRGDVPWWFRDRLPDNGETLNGDSPEVRHGWQHLRAYPEGAKTPERTGLE